MLVVLTQGFYLPGDNFTGKLDKPKWLVQGFDDHGCLKHLESFEDYGLAADCAKELVNSDVKDVPFGFEKI